MKNETLTRAQALLLAIILLISSCVTGISVSADAQDTGPYPNTRSGLPSALAAETLAVSWQPKKTYASFGESVSIAVTAQLESDTVKSAAVTIALQPEEAALLTDLRDDSSFTVREGDGGTYLLSFSVTAGTQFTAALTAVSSSAASLEINADTDVSVVYDGYRITNTYQPGKTSIQVTKRWEGDEDILNHTRPASVTVRLLANGKETTESLILSADNSWTGSFVNLPVNENGTPIVYTVKEAAVSGYTTSITGSAAQGFVVTNTKTLEYGSLTVAKTVAGAAGEKDRAWSFTVTLSDDTVSGNYGDMTFQSGKASFTLKHGESRTASGLPAGLAYTVTEQEANQERYITTASGAAGTIPDGGTATAAFTNSRSSQPADPPPTHDRRDPPDDPGAPLPTGESGDPTVSQPPEEEPPSSSEPPATSSLPPPSSVPDESRVPVDPEIPRTGDTHEAGKWILLSVVSLVGLLLTLIGRRLSRNKHTEP